LSDDELVDCALVTASDVTEARHYFPGAENPTVIELRQGGGFARTLSADPALAGLIGACDGELTVGQITGALAHLLEVDEGELRTSLLPAVRTLLVDGFLRF
ncbi:MAG TPA: SAM-dependent methyltransferase, partial [Candidatus Microbacterium pullistercoris]|nr:SAM-dependent methyltransferase [Candidatus Microbacterium pullistercoris]